MVQSRTSRRRLSATPGAIRATPVRTRCVRPARSRSIRRGRPHRSAFRELPHRQPRSCRAEDGPGLARSATATALAIASRCTYPSGVSPTLCVSSTSATVTSNATPAARSSSARRGEADASTRRLSSGLIRACPLQFEVRGSVLGSRSVRGSCSWVRFWVRFWFVTLKSAGLRDLDPGPGSTIPDPGPAKISSTWNASVRSSPTPSPPSCARRHSATRRSRSPGAWRSDRRWTR